MAAEPFNSAGGYSVGIPPIQIIDEAGNVIATGITASGNVSVTGNVTAATFIGNLQGNISGSFTVAGPNTSVLFNDGGNVATTENFTFNKAKKRNNFLVNQYDQIWQNFTTLAKLYKSDSFYNLAKCLFYFGKNVMLLGKFSLLQIATYFKII